MDLQQLNSSVNQMFDRWNKGFSTFINFVATKLKNFSQLSIGEQISYPAIGLGLILILVSIVLFIV